VTDIYAMQRANGDVFALDNKGRFCVWRLGGPRRTRLNCGESHVICSLLDRYYYEHQGIY